MSSLSNASAPKYQRTDKVQLRQRPGHIGIVLNRRLSLQGWQYEVFFGGGDQRYCAEQALEPVVEIDLDEAGEISSIDFDVFLGKLAVLRLQQPLTDNLYSLYASRTEFQVYQFKPALKFMRNPDQRLLIADEVGLGKTIEAGIIFLELQARLAVERVLIICPSHLRIKWQDEMRSRFDEVFDILDGDGLRRFFREYDMYPNATRLKGIVSLEQIRRREFAEQIAELRVHFDLVIVDEAHHCRNAHTLSHSVVSVISDNADAMLLLTATPLHLGNQDLFNLLHLLSPGEFDYFDGFEQRLEPNRHINKASSLLGAGYVSEALNELTKIEKTWEYSVRFRTNPYYAEVKALLSNGRMSREDMVAAQRRLLDLNTLSNIFTRTRKREVQEKAPVRRAYTLKVTFSPTERRFYDSVVQYVRREYSTKAWYDRAHGWAVIMRERQVASCISAMREYFEKELTDQYRDTPEDEDMFQQLVTSDEDTEFKLTRDPKRAVRQLLEAGRRVGSVDSKFDTFFRALKDLLAQQPDSKVLVFAFFRGTLDYLYRRLSQEGINVRLIHGAVEVVRRQEIVEEFRDDPRIQVLLSSEVGSEGLDFQFCNALFNYDLPWNPMKIEQRIGRLDRFGQPSNVIQIYNLVIEETIEERIFVRLYDRIGIFEESIGDLEAILGEEVRDLSKRIFSARLSKAEEVRLADEAAKRVIRRKQELEAFEAQKLEFMGQDVILASNIEGTIEAGKYLSEAERIALVTGFLKHKFPQTILERDPTDRTYALEPDAEFRRYMEQYIRRTYGGDRTAQEFVKKLNTRDIIPLTFSADLAYERKLLEFLTPRHPLMRAAAQFWEQDNHVALSVAQFALPVNSVAAGQYYFFIFAFDSLAIEQRSNLVSVVIDQKSLEIAHDLSAQFLGLVQQQSSVESEPIEFVNTRFQQAREVAMKYAANERDNQEYQLRRSNEALVSARRAAIEQSYRIKLETIRGYLDSASEARIRRMREAQLKNIEARYAGAVKDLEAQRDVSVSFALKLAGLVHFVPLVN